MSILGFAVGGREAFAGGSESFFLAGDVKVVGGGMSSLFKILSVFLKGSAAGGSRTIRVFLRVTLLVGVRRREMGVRLVLPLTLRREDIS